MNKKLKALIALPMLLVHSGETVIDKPKHSADDTHEESHVPPMERQLVVDGATASTVSTSSSTSSTTSSTTLPGQPKPAEPTNPIQ